MDTIEWVFVIVGIVVVIALYINRDKVKNMLGGGKPPGDPSKRRN